MNAAQIPFYDSSTLLILSMEVDTVVLISSVLSVQDIHGDIHQAMSSRLIELERIKKGRDERPISIRKFRKRLPRNFNRYLRYLEEGGRK